MNRYCPAPDGQVPPLKGGGKPEPVVWGMILEPVRNQSEPVKQSGVRSNGASELRVVSAVRTSVPKIGGWDWLRLVPGLRSSRVGWTSPNLSHQNRSNTHR